MKRKMPTVILSSLIALVAFASGCNPAPTPSGDSSRWHVLPTASEAKRALQQMPGLTGEACKKLSQAQMKCYSRQTGPIYAGGHVDRGSNTGLYAFYNEQGKPVGHAVRATRYRNGSRISWSAPRWDGRYNSGAFTVR
jgi:hypothetical protein